MPFTPSHAVVALPFVRMPIVPAALAVGSMAPDLAPFTGGLLVRYSVTHDPRWLPVTLLIALALLLIWRLLLRPVCRRLAPRAVAERLPEEWDRGPGAALRETFPSAGGIVGLLVALAAGILSHILWDGFTHEGRFGTVLLPVLDRSWGPLPGYKVLQYGSGLGGLIILGIAGARWLRGRTPAPVAPAPPGLRLAWWLSLPAFMVGAVVIRILVSGPPATPLEAYHLAGVLPPACGAWAVLTLGLALVLRAPRRPAAAAGR
ncbi:DUF4184 family protein [Brachybacterium hainanense]|uniref:DUF4184 family protein n=1 Tax=Brachybacterium hainanense TaxID=1541174 RepID=A0ABV6RAN2_9MICO